MSTRPACSSAPSSDDRPLRVVLIQTQAENAGAQEISRILGDGLSRRGFEVHHVFFFRRTEAADTLPNVVFCASSRPSGPVQLLAMLRRLRAEIRRINPDVVVPFQHYGNLIGTLVTKSLGRIPVIANLVSPPDVIHPAVALADRWMGASGFYQVITVNTDDTARAHAGHPAAYRRRIIHIPHGFQDKTSSLSRSEARRRFGLPEDAVVLGTAARLNAVKRLDAAIRLLPHEPSWHVALAGQGPEHDALVQLARDLGVSDRAHFLGELPSTGVGDFYAALDVFLFPSRVETFGLAGVEAAQCGIPVVAHDIPVLHETLSVDGEPAAVFADAGDDAAFLAATRQVVSDKALQERLAGNGRRLSGRYPVSAMIDAYDTQIRALATRR